MMRMSDWEGEGWGLDYLFPQQLPHTTSYGFRHHLQSKSSMDPMSSSQSLPHPSYPYSRSPISKCHPLASVHLSTLFLIPPPPLLVPGYQIHQTRFKSSNTLSLFHPLPAPFLFTAHKGSDPLQSPTLSSDPSLYHLLPVFHESKPQASSSLANEPGSNDKPSPPGTNFQIPFETRRTSRK